MPASLEELFLASFDKDISSKINTTQFNSHSDIAAIERIFKQNLGAAVTILLLPLQLVTGDLQYTKIELLHAAERIRRMKMNAELSPEDEKEALKVALENFNKHIDEPGALESLTHKAGQTLHSYRHLEAVKEGAHELRYQGCIMIWVSLEVLARDLFALILNTRPELMSVLVKEKQSRKLFDLKSIDIETLIDNGFNLSKKMGDLLIDQHPIDTIPSIKTAFGTLQPDNSKLREALSEQQLWLLFQRRHLIVHRRGVVDRTYLEKTKDNLSVGDRLNVSIGDLRLYFHAVHAAGVQMLTAAINIFKGS